MGKKNTIVGFLILCSWSCINLSCSRPNHNSEPHRTYDRKVVRKKIIELVDEKNFSQAKHLLDSLIRDNPKDGYLFYEKGFIEGAQFQTGPALKDFKTAESFNYDKEKCERMIRGVQIMIKYGLKEIK